MKVSIIIPVYNAEKYLRECIESALGQTYDEIEVIAVDDGSTDDSLKILKNYSDRIKIITKENGGTASALNAGINAMNGEWFKWLSADDVLYPNAIEEMIKVVKELSDNSHMYIFYANHILINSESERIGEFIEPNLNELDNFEQHVILLDHFIGNAISGFLHKSVFDKCGLFDEELSFSEDYEFWLRSCILYGFRLYSISKFTAMGRIHEKQLTKTEKTAAFQLLQIKKQVLDQLDKNSKKKYTKALKSWRRDQYSKRVRLRLAIRETLFKLMPYKVGKIFYQNYVKVRNL